MQMNQLLPERWLQDPLYCALKAGHLQTAKRLLDQRESLSWYETAMYAPLALRRPPWLLKRILDLGPEEQICCAGEFVRPGGGWVIRICSTLLVAAAALDDLAAVIELIGRGYHLSFWDVDQSLSAGEPDGQRDWYQEIARSSYQMDLDIVWMEPIGYVHQKEEVYPYDIRRNSEPLSAAIWCGAIRCVERLLPVRAEDISRFARKALSWGPLPGDEVRRQAVEKVVCRKYGMELAELLTPGEFENRDNPLFLPCLERHPEWFNLSIASHFVQEAGQSRWGPGAAWAWNALPLIPEHLLGQVVADLMNSAWKNGKDGSLQRVLSHPQVHLSIDRCSVSPLVPLNCLMAILERMTVIGEAPEGGLSGLAVAVLRAWFICLHVRGDLESQCRQMLESPKAAAILAAEDPKMVQAYLKWRAEQGQVTYQDMYLVMSLVGVKEEYEYGL